MKKEGNGGRIASHQGTFATSKGSSFRQDQGVQLLAQKKQHFFKMDKFETESNLEQSTFNEDRINSNFNITQAVSLRHKIEKGLISVLKYFQCFKNLFLHKYIILL